MYKRKERERENIWTSEISYDAFFCCSLGNTLAHIHTLTLANERTNAHAQTLCLSNACVLAKGDKRSVYIRTSSGCGTASVIACLCGSHSGWIHTELAQRKHNEWTHSFRSFETVCFVPTTIVQLINQRFSKSVSYTDTSSTVLYFYPLSICTHCLWQSVRRRPRHFYRYFNARSTNSSITSSSSSSSTISTQQSNLSNTVDSVAVDFTVTRFAIASTLLLFFRFSIFLWLYTHHSFQQLFHFLLIFYTAGASVCMCCCRLA